MFSSLLVLLPHAAHEAVGGDVEDESDHEQEHPHEEEALEGEGGTAHLIGASSLRRHRRRHRLPGRERVERSEEHTSELQSLMRSSYAVFCLKKKLNTQ